MAPWYDGAVTGGNRKNRTKIRQVYVGFYGTAALKRDLWRIARAEDRSLSVTTCALLRLGLARYFELAGSNPAAARLKSQLEDMMGEAPPERPHPLRGKHQCGSVCREFCAAEAEGQAKFEAQKAVS